VDLGIRGKAALITGASAGLGEAVALALAKEGAKVAVSARRRAVLEDVARRAKEAGAPDSCALAADQTDAQALARVVQEASSRLGPVEILVVNGGGPRPGSYTQVSAADWDQAYALTLKSGLALVDAALPAMRERRWGRIVALTSLTVKQPLKTLVLSNSFRTALVAALKTLAGEVAAQGITVNSIATGFVETDRFRSLYDTAEKKAVAVSGVPIGRPASPEEFAPLVTFLCSEPARYVTGQTISIDGGLISGLFG
jgi:3-oxoacyl-[acyl-carrier protein] reductase